MNDEGPGSLMRVPGHFPRRPGRRGRAKTSAAIGSLCLGLLAAACGSGAHADVNAPGATGGQARSPFAYDKIYDYPDPPLYAAVATLKAQRDRTEADRLAALGSIPTALWAAGQSGEMQQVRSVSAAAAKADAVPVIVAYNLPDRDSCGKFSAAANGPTEQGYLAWVRQLAAAIGSGHDIVIVEPDGLPDIVRGCLSRAQTSERYKLLRYAMQQLGGLPNAYVYLDAGNPGMFPSPASLAGPLKRAGVQFGRGFSANVSNFEWTSVMVGWSQQLERALGGNVGAVIDTSRNGDGPYTGGDSPQWCNPPGRVPGPTPRLDPGPAGIDAYLWIKNPGDSDGPCNGGPAAGQFYLRYALALAQARDRV